MNRKEIDYLYKKVYLYNLKNITQIIPLQWIDIRDFLTKEKVEDLSDYKVNKDFDDIKDNDDIRFDTIYKLGLDLLRRGTYWVYVATEDGLKNPLIYQGSHRLKGISSVTNLPIKLPTLMVPKDCYMQKKRIADGSFEGYEIEDYISLRILPNLYQDRILYNNAFKGLDINIVDEENMIREFTTNNLILITKVLISTSHEIALNMNSYEDSKEMLNMKSHLNHGSFSGISKGDIPVYCMIYDRPEPRWLNEE